MENDERRARDEAKEAVQKIRLEAELLRSAIAETRERIKESHELLARASRVKCPLAEAHCGALIHPAAELPSSSR
jgi:hypothetical protein